MYVSNDASIRFQSHLTTLDWPFNSAIHRDTLGLDSADNSRIA